MFGDTEHSVAVSWRHSSSSCRFTALGVQCQQQHHWAGGQISPDNHSSPGSRDWYGGRYWSARPARRLCYWTTHLWTCDTLSHGKSIVIRQLKRRPDDQHHHHHYHHYHYYYYYYYHHHYHHYHHLVLYFCRLLCIAQAMISQDFCLFVPSVRLSHAGIVSRRLNESSDFFHRRVYSHAILVFPYKTVS